LYYNVKKGVAMYNIGQIIYIYKDSNNSLFPCIVCEEVIKKTLEGIETYYKVLLPDTEGTVVDLSKMDVEVFTDLSLFKKEYVSRASNNAEASIKKCKEISNSKFKSFEKNNLESKSVEEENTTKKKEKIVIEDENNVKLNIDMSKLEELGL
tara:strand:- start:1487 stop:1942 length:456 start_codon:yes stop_codon:yes gene_type:complete